MSLLQEGPRTRRNVKKAGVALAASAAALLAIAGCGNNDIKFPNCAVDPQPKTTTVDMDGWAFLGSSSVTIGEVELKTGPNEGEFNSNLKKQNPSNTLLPTKIYPIEYGISFTDPLSGRDFQVVGGKIVPAYYTTLQIRSQCK